MFGLYSHSGNLFNQIFFHLNWRTWYDGRVRMKSTRCSRSIRWSDNIKSCIERIFIWIDTKMFPPGFSIVFFLVRYWKGSHHKMYWSRRRKFSFKYKYKYLIRYSIMSLFSLHTKNFMFIVKLCYHTVTFVIIVTWLHDFSDSTLELTQYLCFSLKINLYCSHSFSCHSIRWSKKVYSSVEILHSASKVTFN